MQELANCERCGNVFLKTIRVICQDCYKEEEEAFQIVFHFLKDKNNRTATMDEIVEATDVEAELIIKFIKENRLMPKDFPLLKYPCERCGEGISEGGICTSCQIELKKDLETFDKEEEKKAARKKNAQIYYSIDKHKR